MKKDITALFCFVYDFCTVTEEWLKSRSLDSHTSKSVTRRPELSLPEIITIILLYHQSPCKNFKYFYNSYLQLYRDEFPNLLSYNRFIELKSRSLIYLTLLLQWYMHQATNTGISYIDSTSIAVCHPKRISRNKVFAGIAQIGKTTKGWFLGLKLHVIVNDRGELQNIKFTSGNVDDRVPVQGLTRLLTGLLFGDKGYVKKELFQTLYERGLKLVTGIKRSMRNKLMCLFEKVLLRKRSVVETVFDILKHYFELEHTRHRSIVNAFVHLVSTLVAYCLKPAKPSIKHSFLIPN